MCAPYLHKSCTWSDAGVGFVCSHKEFRSFTSDERWNSALQIRFTNFPWMRPLFRCASCVTAFVSRSGFPGLASTACFLSETSSDFRIYASQTSFWKNTDQEVSQVPQRLHRMDFWTLCTNPQMQIETWCKFSCF